VRAHAFANSGYACPTLAHLMRSPQMPRVLSKARLLLHPRYGSILAFSILVLCPRTAPCIKPHATLADLKKLEILCFVPSYLPKGFKLKSVTITYDEPGPDENKAGRYPLYYLEYSNGPSRTGGSASFTIDSAREGIGDRNIMETEDSEETTITSPFGPMYLIYTPRGQGNTASSGSGRIDDLKVTRRAKFAGRRSSSKPAEKRRSKPTGPATRT
jgi:hypothetical protein